MSTKIVRTTFIEASNLLTGLLKDDSFFENVSIVGEMMTNALQKGNKIITCGNGGSMSDAMHFAEELTGRFRENRPGIAAIAVSDPGYLTCAANDFGFDYVFSRFVESMGNSGDVLVGISTSGNSQNVINAFEKAKQKKIICVGLTGKDGGKLANWCDYEIRVPHFGYADRIQEIHIKIIHSLVQIIEYNLF